MDKIASFKVDHMRLVPGIYMSRKDVYNSEVITTLDIRMCRPNFDSPLRPEVSHTIEHFGAMYFRNDSELSRDVVYFGPMGCLTGMYLVLHRDLTPINAEYMSIVSKILSMFKFICDYKGSLVDLGFDPASCGNYSFNDLEGAKMAAANFLVLNDTLGALKFIYPDVENSPEICTSSKIGGDDKLNRLADVAKMTARFPEIDYEDKVEVKIPQEIKEPKGEAEKYVNEFVALDKKHKTKTKKNKVLSVENEVISKDASTLKPLSLEERKVKASKTKVESNTLF